MGSIIMPGQSAVQHEKEVQITWSRDDIHPELAEDLDLNSKLFPKYVKAVQDAILKSLRHPDTRPMIISDTLLKERVEMCHQALYVMRFEMGMALRHCFDILGKKLLEALATGSEIADLVEADGHDKKERWAREAAPVVHTLNEEDLAEGIEPDGDDHGDDPE